MVNIKVGTQEDELIRTTIYLTSNQKKSLDTLSTNSEKSASSLIRNWIDSQAGTRERELSKLRNMREELLLKVKEVDIDIRKLEDEEVLKDKSVTLRKELLSKHISQLTELLIDNGGFLREIEGAIKVRVEGINKKLNGSGVEHVTVEEFRNAVKEAAWNKGVGLHE